MPALGVNVRSLNNPYGRWRNLNFVYEKTRINQVVLADPLLHAQNTTGEDAFVDSTGSVRYLHEDSEAHIEGMDRIERFLSIWEEEGCRMVELSCAAHDAYAANSQFVTHLVGRVLGSQGECIAVVEEANNSQNSFVTGLSHTPIDTSGFESVLKLIDSTTADSFELFYGLYKYNDNSQATIEQLRSAMDEVVLNLKSKEEEESGEKNEKPQKQRAS